MAVVREGQQCGDNMAEAEILELEGYKQRQTVRGLGLPQNLSPHYRQHGENEKVLC